MDCDSATYLVLDAPEITGDAAMLRGPSLKMIVPLLLPRLKGSDQGALKATCASIKAKSWARLSAALQDIGDMAEIPHKNFKWCAIYVHLCQ